MLIGVDAFSQIDTLSIGAFNVGATGASMVVIPFATSQLPPTLRTRTS